MEYIEFLNEINYLSYATALIKYIAFFFILSLVLLFIITKLNLLKRNSRAARILVKSYYFLIPVYFVGFAIEHAPVKNTQSEFNRIIEANKDKIAQATFSFLSTILSDSTLCQQQSANEIVDRYLKRYVYTAGSIMSEKTNSYTQEMVLNIKKKLE